MLFFKKIYLKKYLTVVLFLLTLLTILPLHAVRASVFLMYFHALAGSDFIKLEWETAQEFNNLGFNLYRGLSSDFNNAVKLNNNLIPAQSGGATGAYYEWMDNNVQVGTQYTYWLEDIENDGTATLHDPQTSSPTGGNTIPTAPAPGGGNSTATPTPTRTPTRTPSPTVQSGSTAAPTQTPTRTPTVQPISSNPTATTAPVVQPTAVINSAQPTSAPQSVATAASDPAGEEPVESEIVLDETALTAEAAANATGSEATTTPQQLVQAASASDQGDAASGLLAQQIGQGGQESQDAETVNSSDKADGPKRSTVVVMALIVSIVLLFIGGGGIIVLLLNRSNQTRI